MINCGATKWNTLNLSRGLNEEKKKMRKRTVLKNCNIVNSHSNIYFFIKYDLAQKYSLFIFNHKNFPFKNKNWMFFEAHALSLQDPSSMMVFDIYFSFKKKNNLNVNDSRNFSRSFSNKFLAIFQIISGRWFFFLYKKKSCLYIDGKYLQKNVPNSFNSEKKEVTVCN